MLHLTWALSLHLAELKQNLAYDILLIESASKLEVSERSIFVLFNQHKVIFAVEYE